MIEVNGEYTKIKGNAIEVIYELSNAAAVMADKNKKAPEFIQDLFIECMIIGLASGYSDVDPGSIYKVSESDNENLRMMAKEVSKAIKLIAKAIEEEARRCSGK